MNNFIKNIQDSVVSIIGGAGTGKTEYCLDICMNLNLNEKGIYIDNIGYVEKQIRKKFLTKGYSVLHLENIREGDIKRVVLEKLETESFLVIDTSIISREQNNRKNYELFLVLKEFLELEMKRTERKGKTSIFIDNFYEYVYKNQNIKDILLTIIKELREDTHLYLVSQLLSDFEEIGIVL